MANASDITGLARDYLEVHETSKEEFERLTRRTLVNPDRAFENSPISNALIKD